MLTRSSGTMALDTSGAASCAASPAEGRGPPAGQRQISCIPAARRKGAGEHEGGRGSPRDSGWGRRTSSHRADVERATDGSGGGRAARDAGHPRRGHHRAWRSQHRGSARYDGATCAGERQIGDGVCAAAAGDSVGASERARGRSRVRKTVDAMRARQPMLLEARARLAPTAVRTQRKRACESRESKRRICFAGACDESLFLSLSNMGLSARADSICGPVRMCQDNFDLLPPILPATTACLEACGGTFDCLL